MDEVVLQRIAAVFFALIADDPRFHQRQIWEFARLKLGDALTEEKKLYLLRLAQENGFRRDKQYPDRFEKRVRRPRKRRDTETLPLFGGK